MSNVKVTYEQIDNLMDTAEIEVTTLWNKTTVVSVKLSNGFVLTESSSCVDPENYSEAVGKNLCLNRIRERLWELEGYLLQNKVAVTSDYTNLSFSKAFEQVKLGHGMRLPHWAPDVVVRAQYPDAHSKMTAPYLYVESRYGKVPWKETMIELFAENWEVVV